MNKKDILKIASLSKEEVFDYLQTDPSGLNTKKVKQRQAENGLNIVKQNNEFNYVKEFLKQFTSMFSILLWISGIAALSIGHVEVGIAIILVIVINGIFAFLQECKANKILSSLRDMIPKKVQVYRNDRVEIIDVSGLTIGDLIFLEMGTTIPADARIIESNNFFVDNSMLTGETIVLQRNELPFLQNNQIIAEISNLVYAGTMVAQGSAKAIVYSIGENTQIGEVSKLSQNINKGTSTLKKEIHRVIKIISIIASTLAMFVFFISLWRYGRMEGLSLKIFKKCVIASLGMLVANIPEGLLPTINLSLAIGSQRMAKQKALIKQLFSVETLNSTTVICTDKTGTLTQNQLTCKKILFSEGAVDIMGGSLDKKGEFQNLDIKKHYKVLNKLFIVAIMCSETNLIEDPINNNHFQIIGNPTEGSLLIASAKYGLNIDQVRNNFDIEKLIPFCSETKKMSVLVKNKAQKNYDIDSRYLFVKGAPSVVLKECGVQYKNSKVSSLSQKEKNFLFEENEKLSSQGYRILAIAYKKIEKDEFKEKDMVFLGFFVTYDPPKLEVYDAVQQLLNAGLKISVITGDYGPTAVAIGRQVGIIKDEYINIDGSQIDQMSQTKLQEVVLTKKPIFFSRTTPKHKLRIIEAYRDNEEIVAAIGDGVNDVLAMKSAHIGIAMGNSGKDVARDAADMILLDDNFSTIPKAVLEARGIYANIKKFMSYVFISNIPQIFPVIFMIFFDIPLYLTVMQILAIDLITDLIPAIALGAEEPDSILLNQKPITKKDHLLEAKLLKRSYGFLGIVEGILALLFFLHFGGYYQVISELINKQHLALEIIEKNHDFQFASTMAFGAVIFAQIGNVFACRSDKFYFWQTIKKRNILLYFGIIIELLLFILISQSFSRLNIFFGTQKIEMKHYFYLTSCIFLILLFDTIFKFWINRKNSFKN